jgi:nucleoside-diphosphate-sugar epimerase
MIRIGILSASSQVGSSVAFFLQTFPDLEVTCFVRSTYSLPFFEMLGIKAQFLDLRDERDLSEKIGNMDTILDFGYPAGQLHEILDKSRENIGQVLRCLKKGSQFFYMSSIMAHGMPAGQKWVRSYNFPRTSYAYIKRGIEKYTTALGRQHGVHVYNFRLGQVHGFLQSVNGSFRKKLLDTDLALVDGNPDDPVNIIFIHSLCEAILDCVNGKHPPGLYTLVSDPQWTLKELYEYYLRYYDLPAHIGYAGDTQKRKGKTLLQRLIDLARPYRSLLETYVLIRFPAIATRMKGRFRQMESMQHGHGPSGKLDFIDFNLLGKPPTRVISGRTTEPSEIFCIEKERENYYNSKIAERRL